MITNFATVTLWVEDFKKSVAFYRDTLGLELLTQPGEMPHFKVGGGILVLAKGKFTQPVAHSRPSFPSWPWRWMTLIKWPRTCRTCTSRWTPISRSGAIPAGSNCATRTAT